MTVKRIFIATALSLSYFLLFIILATCICTFIYVCLYISLKSIPMRVNTHAIKSFKSSFSINDKYKLSHSIIYFIPSYLCFYTYSKYCFHSTTTSLFFNILGIKNPFSSFANNDKKGNEKK
jgi:hypothetical protein